MPRGAVFLDRDGTINRGAGAHEYIADAADFELLPGALEGMVRLARAGWPLLVVSNQRGVARGLVRERVLGEIEQVLQRALAKDGVRVEAFYYCCHEESEGCDCRKPRAGMLLRGAREHGLDLGRSWIVGDMPSDAAAGQAAGVRSVLLGVDATDLSAAADLILSRA